MMVGTFYTLVRFYQPNLVNFRRGNIQYIIIISLITAKYNTKILYKSSLFLNYLPLFLGGGKENK